MLTLTLWVIWPALLLWGVDWWLFRRLDAPGLLLGAGWVLLMLVFVLTIRL